MFAPTASRWPISLFPVAFPLSLVLIIWAQAEVSILELIRPAVIAVVGSLLTTLALTALAGDRYWGGIAATTAVVAFVADRPEAGLLLVVAVAVVVVARLAHRRRIRYVILATKVLQGIAAIALIATAISVVGRPGFALDVRSAFLAPPGPAERPFPATDSPDIFLYLIDGYPGATASAQAPWFDATALPTALRERGFTVHDDARSNYLITRQVIPTLFEGRHIQEVPSLAPPFGPDQAVDARRLRRVTERAAGLATIRAAGYDVVWVSAGFSHVDIRNVDRWIEAPGPSELELAILRQSGAGLLLQAIDPNGYARVLRTRIDAVLDQTAAVAAEPHVRPYFVFVHVPAPHPPIVLRADGTAEDGSPGAAWDRFDGHPQTPDQQRRGTFGEVAAIDRLIIDNVDRVRAASVHEPVMILFSDHGTDVGFDPNDTLDSDLAERTSTILAASTPGYHDLFTAPTTPVNIIGRLTNAYLGTDVPEQPDVTYAYDGSVLNVIPVETTPGN